MHIGAIPGSVEVIPHATRHGEREIFPVSVVGRGQNETVTGLQTGKETREFLGRPVAMWQSPRCGWRVERGPGGPDFPPLRHY